MRSTNASYKTSNVKNIIRSKKTQSLNYIVNVGYCKGNWQIESGISYWRSGLQFEKDYITSHSFGPYGNQSKRYPIDYHMSNSHMVIPLSIGYMLNKNKNVSFIPSIGIAAVCNIDNRITTDGNILQETISSITYDANPICLQLMGSMELQCKVSKHCDFWLRPSYQHMITPSLKSSSTNYLSSMYEYALFFNAGITYTIRQQHYTVAVADAGEE